MFKESLLSNLIVYVNKNLANMVGNVWSGWEQKTKGPGGELKDRQHLFSLCQATFHIEKKKYPEENFQSFPNKSLNFHNILGHPPYLRILYLALGSWAPGTLCPQCLQSQSFFPLLDCPHEHTKASNNTGQNLLPLQLSPHFCSLLWQNSLKKLYFSTTLSLLS